jgi:hypothetical protein
MSGGTCDICGQPATIHYCYASAYAGGGQAEEARSVSLCAEHAVLHEQAECRRRLDEMQKSLWTFAQRCEPTRGMEFHVYANDEGSARSFQIALIALCGGEASVSSPEEIIERMRRVRAKWRPDVPFDPHTVASRWEVSWKADATMSLADQWQTEGWSQRLYDLIVAHGCGLGGWGLRKKDAKEL